MFCVDLSRSRAELRERGELAVLREVETQRTGDLLHRLDLRVAADSRDRDADVDGRADALEEQVGLQEDLAVGDRDDVGRDVGRHVAGLRLDDRQRGERAGAVGVGELDRALEQAAVQVEDVTRVRLAARRAAQRERHLAVRDGLLGEVVVDAQHVAARDCLAEAGLPSAPLYMKYSPMAQPAIGAMYCSGAGSDALAATTIV